MTILQAFRSAVLHHQAGRLAEAERGYRRILAQQPDHADAMHLLGVIAHQAGRHEIAVDLIGRAVRMKPAFADALTNLGAALMQCGQLDEAIAAFEQAVVFKPSSPEIQNNLGNALTTKGRLDEAITACRQAIALKAEFPAAHYNLGNALAAKGQFADAIAAYQHAILFEPAFSAAHSNCGNAMERLGRLDDALVAYRRALELNPNSSETYSNLGVVLKASGQMDEAIKVYRRAIGLRPLFPGAWNNLVYALHFHGDYDARAIADEHRRWNREQAEPLKGFITAHANARDPTRRLRIGYVSPDFREHPVGRFLLPLLQNHDRKNFEVFAYAQVGVPDSITSQLRSCTDAWKSIVGLSDGEVADLLREDRVDLLVDLTMHMDNSRLLAFARKPAPVQVTYLAYCSTTGLDTIDYRISDPWLDPPGADESVYSEQTIRLPETYWCYQPAIVAPEIGPAPALGRGFITFGCLNNFSKVSKSTLAAWARLLQMIPGSQLLLHAHEGSHRQRLRHQMEREGIEPARLHFVGPLPARRYFALYGKIDIALDPFPYGGGTTTCDALWMGVPVVSLAGKTAVGRGGLSILSNIRLSDLVARSEDEYVRIAGELADDLLRLSSLRSTLRRRMEQSPLMDARTFARNIEAAYRQMWATWCEQGEIAKH